MVLVSLFPQTEQVLVSVPVVSQPAAFVVDHDPYLCPVAATVLVSLFPQTEQVLVSVPVVSQPAAFVTDHDPYLCPVAA